MNAIPHLVTRISHPDASVCLSLGPAYDPVMSVEEIKKGLMSLSESEQGEVTAFLFHLRHAHDPDYEAAVSHRLLDTDKSHWLTPEEFEQRLFER